MRFLRPLLPMILLLVSVQLASALPTERMRTLVSQGEALLEEREFSRARWCLQQAFTEMDAADYNSLPYFYERLANDITECEIYLDDCGRAYPSYAYRVTFSTPRERIRYAHLGFLLWQRSIIMRAFGKEKSMSEQRRYVEQEMKLFGEEKMSLSPEDRDSFGKDLMNDRLELAYATGDSGMAEALQKEYRKAAEGMDPSDSRWPWLWYMNDAAAYSGKGRQDKALTVYGEVLDFCLEYNIEDAYIPCLNMIDILYSQGRLQQAHDVLQRTARAIRSTSLTTYRKMTSGERYTAWGNATTVKAYKALPGLPEGLYEDILYGAALYSKNVLMDIYLEESESSWHPLDMDLLKAWRLRTLFAGTDNSLVAEWAFKDSLAERRPVFSAMEGSWKDVQSQLGDRDVAVEIIRTGGSFSDYTAVVVRKGWDFPRAVRLCTESDLDALGLGVELYRDENSRKGYDLLVRPLEKYISRGDNVFFSPEGTVNAINVGALADSDGTLAADKYDLFRVTSTLHLSRDNTPKRYDDMYLFGAMDYACPVDSLRIYDRLMRSSDPFMWFDEVKTYPLRGLSFGTEEDGTRSGLRPLQYTETELNNIESLAPSGMEIHMMTGWRANEECFKKCCSPIMLNATSIYHIATHSFSMPEDPSMSGSWLSAEEIAFKRSGLMFSGAARTVDGGSMPDGVNDGMLYAEEIAALDMRNADMVVLSACNTALGEYSLNGVLGLQRAFKEAGCRTIVMTLWKVNDKATSLFMTTFYRALFSGMSKHDAFGAARRAVKAQYDDPYYWAPFIMLD